MAKGKKKKSEALELALEPIKVDGPAEPKAEPKASKKDKSQDYFNHAKFSKFKN